MKKIAEKKKSKVVGDKTNHGEKKNLASVRVPTNRNVVVGEDTNHGEKKNLPWVCVPTNRNLVVGEDTNHGEKKNLSSVRVPTNRNVVVGEDTNHGREKDTNQGKKHSEIKKNIIAKPVLKWAGGKSQLIATIDELLPVELKEGKIKTYFEPFVGGGALYFHIAQKYKIKSAVLNDINTDLILLYTNIQQKSNDLITELNKIEKKYKALDKEHRYDFYYMQRDLFNEPSSLIQTPKKIITRAAQLVFLNRTCFNGLYRINSKGLFNTPAGDYANPTICDQENILAVSKLFQKAELRNESYHKILKKVNTKSFVYFDPPYRPLNATSSFTSYNQSTFKDEDQILLADFYKLLNKKSALLMLSNSDPKNTNPKDNFFDSLFSGFNIQRISAKRNINSVSKARGSISEILVMNYSKIV